MYEIKFISTAGNYFLMKDGQLVSLDPNFEQGQEILRLLNGNQQKLQQHGVMQAEPMKTAKQYIIDTYGENWTDRYFQWDAPDVIEALENYAIVLITTDGSNDKTSDSPFSNVP